MSSYRDPATGQTRIEYWENGDKNGYQATVEICITCNTKILNNKIEKPFEAVFKEMREGRAVTLNADSVKHMATWAAKTAMTKELLDKEGRRGDLSIPEWQYRWLHDHVSPPNAMLMFFGKVENTPNGYHHHHRFRLSLDVPESAGHVTTFVVGQFWVVVVGFAHEDMFDAFKDGFDEFYSQSHLRSLTRFWPPDTDEVGFQNPPAPQVFPPGPEATFTLCEAVRNGPKKMSATVDGVKINVQSSPQALPSEGPINVTINGQRKNVQLVKGRPPGSLGQGHPDDMMMFIQD
ncbi:hypothetical protein [Mycobacterium sp. M26]|uniref:hypothetical protein n=1 Tax=Mycobacterium sp. M26 TaxID=1762962 RepID=UPI000A80B4C1|nr:hypothetical protein [Mycobacterium sp. M26]